MNDMAKLLMIMGAGLFFAGVLLYAGARLSWFGSLPGDVVVKRENFVLYAPLGTMILVSIVLTILLNIIRRWFR